MRGNPAQELGGHLSVENDRTVFPNGEKVGATMLYRLGRFLQLFGLVLLPVGVAGNLARPEEVTVKTSLAIAAAGVALFYLGRTFQRAGGGSE
jgi:hypothetical protein